MGVGVWDSPQSTESVIGCEMIDITPPRNEWYDF